MRTFKFALTITLSSALFALPAHATLIPVTVEITGSILSTPGFIVPAGNMTGTYDTDTGYVDATGTLIYPASALATGAPAYSLEQHLSVWGLGLGGDMTPLSCTSIDTSCSAFTIGVPVSFPVASNTTYSDGINAFGAFTTEEPISSFASSTDTLIITYTISSVPVPGALWLFGSAVAGLAGVKRRA